MMRALSKSPPLTWPRIRWTSYVMVGQATSFVHLPTSMPATVSPFAATSPTTSCPEGGQQAADWSSGRRLGVAEAAAARGQCASQIG
jgi:hypothetical protein